MPQSLAPIPQEMQIVDEGGAITEFFRLRWQQLIDAFTLTPSAATVFTTAQTAAIGTSSAFVTRQDALYRVSYYLRKTQADGVSSSLTFTWGWIDGGVALTESAAALTLDSVIAEQSGSKVVMADASSGLTYAVAYASNTPGQMAYSLSVSVEQLA